MNEVVTFNYTIDQVDEIAQWLVNSIKGCSVVTFSGLLGAGKTTLIKAIIHALGIEEVIVSPTFSYVNIYKTPEGKTIYHFDLYRIKTINDFLALGFDQYLFQPNSLALIEWPEVIESLLKKETCRVLVEYKGKDERILHYYPST